jgi:hypothetical protein
VTVLLENRKNRAPDGLGHASLEPPPLKPRKNHSTITGALRPRDEPVMDPTLVTVALADLVQA